MKNLTKESLMKLVQRYGEVVILVREIDGHVRKRLITNDNIIVWRYLLFEDIARACYSCFEQKKNGGFYRCNVKESINRMYKHDQRKGFKISAAMNRIGDLYWGFNGKDS